MAVAALVFSQLDVHTMRFVAVEHHHAHGHGLTYRRSRFRRDAAVEVHRGLLVVFLL